MSEYLHVSKIIDPLPHVTTPLEELIHCVHLKTMAE